MTVDPGTSGMVVLKVLPYLCGPRSWGSVGDVRITIRGRNMSFDCRENEWTWSGIPFQNVCCKCQIENIVVEQHFTTDGFPPPPLLLVSGTTPITRGGMFWHSFRRRITDFGSVTIKLYGGSAVRTSADPYIPHVYPDSKYAGQGPPNG